MLGEKKEKALEDGRDSGKTHRYKISLEKSEKGKPPWK